MRPRQSVIIDGRYISDGYPGIGRYVFNLVAALASKSEELTITLLVANGERQTRFDLAELESRGVELLALRSRLQSAGGLLEGWRAARRAPPALFHAPHVLSPVPSGLPTLTTIHDLIPTHASGRLPAVRHRFVYRALLRRALSSASAFVTSSRAVGIELQERCGVPPERITVAPLAADPAFRPLPPDHVAAERARLGLPQRYVLYVGSNRPHKNLPRLLEAWGGVPRERRDGCRLVIAGALDERFAGVPRDAASDAAGIVLLGPVAEADLPSVYGAARLVVHPALHEGFGLTIIEAMACGVAVACSTVASLDEVCGDAALRFDPTDVADMTAAIDRLLTDEPLRARLASDGLARASRLSWARTADLTITAYRRALDRSGA